MGLDLVVVGCQWGDEGKGKLTDVLCEGADAVVRYQAGPQTGHTVVTMDGEFRFSQIPSGVTRGIVGVLGNGCVIDPARLIRERDEVSAMLPGHLDLRISETAHVIMPYHQMQDKAMERWRGDDVAISIESGLATGSGRIGSTTRGAGPCREDKIARIGIRMVDLLDRKLLLDRLQRVVPLKRALIEDVYGANTRELGDPLDVEALVDEYWSYGRTLEPYLTDVSQFLQDARDRNAFLLYEGTQSIGLDVDHGSYPYVSSGYSAAPGVTVGTGTPPTVDFEVIGVAKAYTARVGGGPLPTVLTGDLSDHLVVRGREYGTVTGRRRRVGWLDLSLLRRSIRMDGVRALCLTNLDVLGGLDEIRIATHYRYDGEPLLEFPTRLSVNARLEPEYETLPGWEDEQWDEVAMRGFEALPLRMRDYINFVRDALGVPVVAVGIGPRREETVLTPEWESVSRRWTGHVGAPQGCSGR